MTETLDEKRRTILAAKDAATEKLAACVSEIESDLNQHGIGLAGVDIEFAVVTSHRGKSRIVSRIDLTID